MRRRLVAAFDDFVDLETASHTEAAGRIRGDQVDILVDLKGYTRDARPGILAMRPAPIQVSYLGYPGTMGTQAVDYIVADRFVIPANQQPYYTENVVYLPECYQVNDPTRKIAARVPGRPECGLPDTGFVFCCFNASDKLTQNLFQIWVRLLQAAPDSVLWLLASNDEMVRNLRREAEARLAGGARRLRVRAGASQPGTPGPASGGGSVSRYASVQRAHAGQRCAVGGLPGDHLPGGDVCVAGGGEPPARGGVAGTGHRLSGGLCGTGGQAGARTGATGAGPGTGLRQTGHARLYLTVGSSGTTWKRHSRSCGGVISRVTHLRRSRWIQFHLSLPRGPQVSAAS